MSIELFADEVHDTYKFGRYNINPKEVFTTSRLSFSFVNEKPVVPGHVLVSPKRVVHRFKEMTAEEVADLWLTAQFISLVVGKLFQKDDMSFVIQDGSGAGQTVPHVHVHVMPRVKGDFTNNDDVYTALESKNLERDESSAPRAPDAATTMAKRSAEEMYEEAAKLRFYAKSLLEIQNRQKD